MLGQISFSRKSRAWAIRRFPDGPRAILSLRSSKARRMVAVLDSPVMCASSAANRSTLSFLIFMAMVERFYQSTTKAGFRIERILLQRTVAPFGRKPGFRTRGDRVRCPAFSSGALGGHGFARSVIS